MAVPHHYSMKWDNYHSHVGDIFSQLLETGSMADVILYAEGLKINCHKILLSACSPYFQEILSTAGASNTIVVVSGINGEDVKSIIEFVYRGEISVKADRFASVLKAAEALKICGLKEVSSHLDIEEPETCIPTVIMDKKPEHDVTGSSFIDESQSTPAAEIIKREPQSATGSTEEGQEIVDAAQSNNGSDNSDDYHDNLMITDDDNNDSDEKSKEDRINENVDAVHDKSNIPFGNIKMETGPDGSRIQYSKNELKLENSAITEEIKCLRRKEMRKKMYSEEAMLAALEDMRLGKNLVKAAAKHRVPRTTLYTRARAIGACPNISRKGYPREKMNAALQSVAGGSSLQCAATEFGIPKTVLWRRAQKEIGNRAYSKRVKLQSSTAQINSAIEDGVSITRVSSQYQIPKATLFRWEKLCLVNNDKKSTKPALQVIHNNDESRLKEDQNNSNSVDADGRVSATIVKKENNNVDDTSCNNLAMISSEASDNYKTTKPVIWRKSLLKNKSEDGTDCADGQSSPILRKNKQDPSNENTATVEQIKHFQFSEGVHELPVSCIENPEFSGSSIIILPLVDHHHHHQPTDNKFIASEYGLRETLSQQIFVKNTSNDREAVVTEELLNPVKVDKN